MNDELEFSLHKAFIGYVTMIEHFRNLQSYREGARILRQGLPKIARGEPGFRDVKCVQQFCEQIMVEEDDILEMVCEDDAAATIEALSSMAKNILMTNPQEIKSKIFMT